MDAANCGTSADGQVAQPGMDASTMKKEGGCKTEGTCTAAAGGCSATPATPAA